MAFGGFPVAQLGGHAGGAALRLEILGGLFGDAADVAVGGGQVAALFLDPGQQHPRLAMRAVELEDVPQLDHGAGNVAFLEQGQAPFEMFLGAFLGRVAGRGGKNRGQQDRGQT